MVESVLPKHLARVQFPYSAPAAAPFRRILLHVSLSRVNINHDVNVDIIKGLFCLQVRILSHWFNRIKQFPPKKQLQVRVLYGALKDGPAIHFYLYLYV